MFAEIFSTISTTYLGGVFFAFFIFVSDEEDVAIGWAKILIWPAFLCRFIYRGFMRAWHDDDGREEG